MDNIKAKDRRRRSDEKYLEREPLLIQKLTELDRDQMYLYRNYCLDISTKKIDGEQWFDIPDWEGCYQISNFLRLKSVRINKLRKPRINYKHYFDTSFYKNSKSTYLIYSRIVAKVLVPNPNNLPEVNHKNGIRWDNRPENLEWVTGRENRIHSIKELGSDFSRPIVQLSMGGKFLRRWNSISDAAKSVNGSDGNISITCQNKNAYAYGYIWLYQEDFDKNGIKYRTIYERWKPVSQFTKQGEFIADWESMDKVEKELCIFISHIAACCKGKIKTAKGFCWEYKIL
jgi:hypothetical protein